MRVAILSDAHANLPGLKAILDDARSHSAEAIWNLGDAIDYGPQPNEVIGLLRREAELHLAGNHELLLAGRLDEAEFSDLALHCNAWTKERISDKNRTWLEHLQPRQDTYKAGRSFTLAHGSPLDPAWDYLRDKTQATAVLLACPKADFIACGHTHTQAVWHERADLLKRGKQATTRALAFKPNLTFPLGCDRWAFTVGAGIPNDPDNRRVGYLLLDLSACEGQMRRVKYDREAAKAAYKGTGLDPILAKMI